MNRTLPFKNSLKYLLRKLCPIPKPPQIDLAQNICTVELVPYDDLLNFYQRVFDKYFLDKKTVTHLEFGVFNGTSIAVAYQFYNCRNLSDYRILGFDSFKGLPKECEKEDSGVWKEGMYRCAQHKTKECLSVRGIDTKKIEFIDGWYKDTLNINTSINLGLKYIDVVFIDSDTSSSCSLVLEFIKPLIKNVILICFDDWKLNDLDLYEMGESKAFTDFLRKENSFRAVEVKSYNRKSKSFLLYKDIHI